ncbi:MAG: zinc ribbon domain-containing protein [Acidobacteria bacterium]|nr:zinc ribbon domain-containing protein [Acidobacteriota bacterium]
MKCRQCGSEIADKAIVCYRCGTATTEPKFKTPAAPASAGSRSSMTLVTSVLAIVLLALSALYMQRVVTVGAPGALRWLIVVLAAALVVLRVIARRTRR